MFKQFVIILLVFVLMTSMIMMIILVSNSFFQFYYVLIFLLSLFKDYFATSTENTLLLLFLMDQVFVKPQTMPRLGSLSTLVTNKRDTFQVFGLDVVSNGHPLTFFSTDFANTNSGLRFSDRHPFGAFLDQRLHLLIQLLEVIVRIILGYNCTFRFAHLFWLESKAFVCLLNAV